MKRNLEIRTLKFGFFFALLVVLAVDSSAQTLADIAKKERERQKQVRSSVSVSAGTQGAAAVTSATTSSTAAVASPPAAAAAKPAGPLDNNGRDEKFWRAAFQKARDDAKRAEDKVTVTELKLKQLNSQLLQNSEIYNREYRLGPQITGTQTELDAARKEAEQAKQRISQLEDELRRAGGLPGWAR